MLNFVLCTSPVNKIITRCQQQAKYIPCYHNLTTHDISIICKLHPLILHNITHSTWHKVAELLLSVLPLTLQPLIHGGWAGTAPGSLPRAGTTRCWAIVPLSPWTPLTIDCEKTLSQSVMEVRCISFNCMYHGLLFWNTWRCVCYIWRHDGVLACKKFYMQGISF